jgi:hypothetical protein
MRASAGVMPRVGLGSRLAGKKVVVVGSGMVAGTDFPC